MHSLLFQAERLVSAHGGDSIRQADTFSDLLFKKFPHRFQMLPGKILPFSRQLFQNAPDHVALQKRRFAAHRITQHNRIFLCGCIPLHQLIRLLLQIFLRFQQVQRCLCHMRGGTRIDNIADLQPGDILCWSADSSTADPTRCTHVGIYVGAGTVDGKEYKTGVFIESSRGAGKVRYWAFQKATYYTKRFMNAWRMF